MTPVSTNVLLLLLSSSSTVLGVEANLPIVETIYGRIQGQILSAIQDSHLKFYAFRGIPYAKPPLGKLRFQPPVKPEPWNGLKKCENYGPPCPQIDKYDASKYKGNEDCLTLNVFTRELNPDNLRPVMFWIHPGGHIKNWSGQFGPDYLVEKPIVLVTINFRINIFGFLTVNDENAYGNAGIKDQIAGLRWVQENIAKFGGDPSKVTIFGESSGANSVSLLQLSPQTKGLFHQIIVQSGSPLNPRYLQRDPLRYVYNIGKYFNISTDTTKDLVEGLQKIDCEKLTKAANDSKILGYRQNLEGFPFVPVIEAQNSHAIITQSPYELLESGNFNKVPFILGYTTNEGSLGLNLVYSGMNIEDFDTNYELFVPRSLDNRKEQMAIGKTVRDFFLGNSSATDIEKFTEFLGQELVVRGLRKTLDFYKKHNITGYFYRFSYKGTHTIKEHGVGHAEEIQYILVISEQTANLTKSDIETRKRMVQMWTNFAIFGLPIPEEDLFLKNVSWKPNNNDETVYFLDIDKELKLGLNPDNEEYLFWKNIFTKYGNKPLESY